MANLLVTHTSLSMLWLTWHLISSLIFLPIYALGPNVLKKIYISQSRLTSTEKREKSAPQSEIVKHTTADHHHHHESITKHVMYKATCRISSDSYSNKPTWKFYVWNTYRRFRTHKFLLIKQSWNPIIIEICGPNLKRYRKRHQELVLIFCRMEHLIHDQMNIGGWSAFSPDPWSTSHHSHGSGFKASQPPLCNSS